jgi:hypothetical protein
MRKAAEVVQFEDAEIASSNQSNSRNTYNFGFKYIRTTSTAHAPARAQAQTRMVEVESWRNCERGFSTILKP